MQISLRKRAFPTISFKGAEGLTRFDLVSYNMGQEQRPGSDKDLPAILFRINSSGGAKDWMSRWAKLFVNLF